MEVYYSSRFRRHYKKLSPSIKFLAQKKDALFRKNPRDPKLKLHGLGGALKGYFAFSIDFHYRIIVRFRDENSALFYDIGTHDIYE